MVGWSDRRGCHEWVEGKRTSDAGKELTSELLDVAAGKGNKLVAFEEIEDALAEQVGDDADVVLEIKRFSKVDALVAVVLVVLCQGGEDSQLDAGSISVLLHGSDDLDGDLLLFLAVEGLDDLAEGALAQ